MFRFFEFFISPLSLSDTLLCSPPSFYLRYYCTRFIACGCLCRELMCAWYAPMCVCVYVWVCLECSQPLPSTIKRNDICAFRILRLIIKLLTISKIIPTAKYCDEIMPGLCLCQKVGCGCCVTEGNERLDLGWRMGIHNAWFDDFNSRPRSCHSKASLCIFHFPFSIRLCANQPIQKIQHSPQIHSSTWSHCVFYAKWMNILQN